MKRDFNPWSWSGGKGARMIEGPLQRKEQKGSQEDWPPVFRAGCIEKGQSHKYLKVR